MWLVRDCCGLILAVMTWHLMIYAEFVVIYVLLWTHPWVFYKLINIVLFQVFILLAVFSHLRSMLTDPGVVEVKYNERLHGSTKSLHQNTEENISLMPNNYLDLETRPDRTKMKSWNSRIEHCFSDSDSDNVELIVPEHYNNSSIYLNYNENYKAPIYRCLKCYSIKPFRAHHCSTCKKCIKKMDHHCPWINNCVGENNQKYFVLFNIYVLLSGVHALMLAGHHAYTCFHSDWEICTRAFTPPTAFLLILFLAFESLLFIIFCAVMTGMQIHRVITDTTGIEILKGNNVSPKRKIIHNLREVFGDKMTITWLSPFHHPKFSHDAVLRGSFIA